MADSATGLIARRVSSLLTLALLLGTAVPSEANAAPLEAATHEAGVAAVDHSVQVQLHGKWRAAVVGDVLHNGDRIKTGVKSTATLMLCDKTVMRMSQKTEIVVNDLSVGEKGNLVRSFQLMTGRVWSDVVPNQVNPTTFEVRGPNAVAAVKGTAFEVDAGDDSGGSQAPPEAQASGADPSRPETSNEPPEETTPGPGVQNPGPANGTQEVASPNPDPNAEPNAFQDGAGPATDVRVIEGQVQVQGNGPGESGQLLVAGSPDATEYSKIGTSVGVVLVFNLNAFDGFETWNRDRRGEWRRWVRNSPNRVALGRAQLRQYSRDYNRPIPWAKVSSPLRAARQAYRMQQRGNPGNPPGARPGGNTPGNGHESKGGLLGPGGIYKGNKGSANASGHNGSNSRNGTGNRGARNTGRGASNGGPANGGNRHGIFNRGGPANNVPVNNGRRQVQPPARRPASKKK
jgi:hypothetical protein